jgi:hypothetical protein
LLTFLPIAVAVGTVLWFFLLCLPHLAAGLATIMLWFVIPVALLVVVIHGAGYQKTFCLGAMFPTSAQMLLGTLACGALSVNRYGGFRLGYAFEAIGESVAITGVTWALALLVGLVAVGVRALVESANRSDSPPEEPPSE